MSLCVLTFLQSIVMGLAYASTGVFRSVTPLLGKLVAEYYSLLFLLLASLLLFLEVCLTSQRALVSICVKLTYTHKHNINFPHPLSWCSL